MVRLIYEKEKLEIEEENKRKRDSRTVFSFHDLSKAVSTTVDLNNVNSNLSTVERNVAFSSINSETDKKNEISQQSTTHRKKNETGNHLNTFNYAPMAVNAFRPGTKVSAPPEFISPTMQTNNPSDSILTNKEDKNMQANRDALTKHFKPGYLQERKELLNNNEINDPDKNLGKQRRAAVPHQRFVAISHILLTFIFIFYVMERRDSCDAMA
jgi:hypothetical protein